MGERFRVYRVNGVSTAKGTRQWNRVSAERRTSREDSLLMLAAFVLAALLSVVGLAAYIFYLTPNPKDPI